nr:MAG TPA: hypothetical protein [Caudoviricetes sp.]
MSFTVYACHEGKNPTPRGDVRNDYTDIISIR